MLNGLNRKIAAGGLAGVLGLIAVGGAVWYVNRHQLATQISPSPSPLTTDQATISQIKQLLGIPASENPTVADITDKTKMQNQPFFSSSENGDQVLVFSQSKKIVLYRPSTGKVINLAPLDESSSSAQTASSSATPGVVKVVIRNGTTTKGLAAKLQTQVKQIMPQAQTSGENAAKTDYKTSLIAVLNPKSQAAAETLAQELGIKIGDLPADEEKPTADLIVILGQDEAR